MTPLARARHRDASAAGERPAERHRRTERYYEERAAIVAMLKNYGLPSLLWLLPLAILHRGRSGWRTWCSPDGSRARSTCWRPGDGTSCTCPGRSPVGCGRSPCARFPIASCAGSWSPPACGCRAGSPRRGRSSRSSARSRSRTRTPPSADGCATEPPRSSGRIPSSSPRSSARWWRRSRSGACSGRSRCTAEPCRCSRARGEDSSASWRPATGRPGSAGRSRRVPSLGAMGALSWLSFGSTAHRAEGVARGRADPGVVMLYRALARLTGRPGAAVLGRRLLRTVRDGAVELLGGPHRAPGGAVRACPSSSSGSRSAFGRGELPDGRWRFIAGVAVTLAVGIAFMPGVALAVGGARRRAGPLRVGTRARARRSRRRLFAAAARAPVPVRAHHDLRWRRRARVSTIGTTDLGALARLALGGGPGTWSIAAFLPIAAVLAFSLVGPEHRGVASRAVLSAVAGLALAWCSSAGYLPAWAANAPIYLALAAVGEALVVGLGLSSVLSGLGRESFGLRQIGTGVVGGRPGRRDRCSRPRRRWSADGRWGARTRLPPAWAVVSSSAKGEFRVIWLGADTGTLVRRARRRPGGRRAERRVVAPVRADGA